MARPRKRFDEIWNGRVFYDGRWTLLTTIERKLARMRQRYRAARGLA